MSRTRPPRTRALRGGALLAVVCALALGSSAAAPATAGPRNVEVTAVRDLVYAPPGDLAHRLDLYLPSPAREPLPVVVYIHGGGWLGGDKASGPDFVEHFANDGYAMASINYRLAREAVFPAQLTDVQNAIRWLRANAATYGLDPDRIALWGSSSGGHLAALAGTAGGQYEPGEAINGESARVQAVVDWKGPTNLLLLADHAHPESRNRYEVPGSPENRLIGCPTELSGCAEAARRADPATYISPDDPPFLIMHGDDDRTVGYQQSVVFYEALRDACATATLYLLEGVDHGTDLDRSLERRPPVGRDVFATDGCRYDLRREGPPARWDTLERFFSSHLRR